MLIRHRKRAVSRAGVAAVELAVVLPLLVFLLVGVWEVGRIIEVQQVLTNAAREGGRQVSTAHKTFDQCKEDVVNYLKLNGITSVSTSDVTIVNLTDASRDPINADQLDRFRITVSVPVESIRWILLDRLTTVTHLTVQVDWYSMRDIPITVNDVIPLN